jgi:hypothetical protein
VARVARHAHQDLMGHGALGDLVIPMALLVLLGPPDQKDLTDPVARHPLAVQQVQQVQQVHDDRDLLPLPVVPVGQVDLLAPVVLEVQAAQEGLVDPAGP